MRSYKVFLRFVWCSLSLRWYVEENLGVMLEIYLSVLHPIIFKNLKHPKPPIHKIAPHAENKEGNYYNWVIVHSPGNSNPNLSFSPLFNSQILPLLFTLYSFLFPAFSPPQPNPSCLELPNLNWLQSPLSLSLLFQIYKAKTMHE